MWYWTKDIDDKEHAAVLNKFPKIYTINKKNEIPLMISDELDVIFVSDDKGDDEEYIYIDKDETYDIPVYDSNGSKEFINISSF